MYLAYCEAFIVREGGGRSLLGRGADGVTFLWRTLNRLKMTWNVEEATKLNGKIDNRLSIQWIE